MGRRLLQEILLPVGNGLNVAAHITNNRNRLRGIARRRKRLQTLQRKRMGDIFAGNQHGCICRTAVTLTHTVATIGATTGVVLAANANRKYALIVNDSDSTVYIKIGAAAVLNQGIRLNASGGSYEMSAAAGNLDTRAINGISSAAAKLLLVTEGS